MKKLKLICVCVLAVLTALTAAGCHKKNEIAVKTGNIKFTSAYYMCALINADNEAKSKVKEELDDDKSTEDIDYYSKKIDGKKFVKWVEDTALENVKKIAAYKTLCKKADLELDEETESNVDSYVEYYWTNYGYSQYYEPNGVSKETYAKYMKDAYYSNLYFEHLYGEGGEKEISAEDVKAATIENFVLADKLEADFSSKTDEEKASLKEQFNSYVTALNSGEKTFEEVYKEYNGTTDTEETEETDSEELKPVNKYASVLGTEDTGYASDYFDDASEMAVGEVKLIELDDDAGLVLLVKRDLAADEYYVKNLDLSSRHLLKDDEYEDFIEDYVKKMDFEISNYAIRRFKVKNIAEPSATA